MEADGIPGADILPVSIVQKMFCHLSRIIHRYFDIGRGSVNVDFEVGVRSGNFLDPPDGLRIRYFIVQFPVLKGEPSCVRICIIAGYDDIAGLDAVIDQLRRHAVLLSEKCRDMKRLIQCNAVKTGNRFGYGAVVQYQSGTTADGFRIAGILRSSPDMLCGSGSKRDGCAVPASLASFGSVTASAGPYRRIALRAAVAHFFTEVTAYII